MPRLRYRPGELIGAVFGVFRVFMSIESRASVVGSVSVVDLGWLEGKKECKLVDWVLAKGILSHVGVMPIKAVPDIYRGTGTP